MTTKFDAFVADLEALCRKHQVHLSASMYDCLQVWDLAEGEEPITSAGIDDRTKAPNASSEGE